VSWTFEATKAGYGNLWRTIKIKASAASDVDWFARKIIAGEAAYKNVEAATGVPWWFIGALHMRESSNSFAGVLHNGEKIIGTGRKTTLVPKGRGPFRSWDEAAIDALKIKSLQNVPDWSIERVLFEAERFNGLGYANKGVNSPYVWAGSNHQQPGKYIADHVWSSTANDTQMGVATVIKRLTELRADIAESVNDGYVPPPPDVPTDKPTKPTPQPEHWLIRLLKWLFWRRS
jgi:lysozyme family protein